MTTVSQMTFSNAFSRIKSFVFQFEFHWSLYPRVILTISNAENVSIWWRHHVTPFYQYETTSENFHQYRSSFSHDTPVDSLHLLNVIITNIYQLYKQLCHTTFHTPLWISHRTLSWWQWYSPEPKFKLFLKPPDNGLLTTMHTHLSRPFSIIHETLCSRTVFHSIMLHMFQIR